MKKGNHVIAADMCFLAVVLLLFAGMVFLPIDYSNYSFNVIVLCLAALLFIITYFTSFRLGLVLNMIFIFLFLAYAIAQAVREGKAVGVNTYFWIFWPAAMNLSISGYVWQNRLLGEANRELNDKMEQLATIDAETQMNNLLAFERDAAVYMNISRRYQLELVLILWKLASQEEVERLAGKSNMQEVVNIISDVAKERLRGEDLIYMVEKEPYTWGALLFTHSGSVDMIRKRLEQAVTGVKFDRFTRQKAVVLDLAAAVKIYDGSMKTPLAFLTEAKQEFDSRTRRETKKDSPAGKDTAAARERGKAAMARESANAAEADGAAPEAAEAAEGTAEAVKTAGLPGEASEAVKTAETAGEAPEAVKTAETAGEASEAVKTAETAGEAPGAEIAPWKTVETRKDEFDLEITDDDDWDV